MNDCKRWDILGYVLEDPELDRADFESKMLADVNLAMEVASAVQQVELFRKAFRFSGAEASVPANIRPTNVQATQMSLHWSSLCGLAVALLVAIGLGQAQLRRLVGTTEPNALVSASSAQVLAERWLALRIETRSDGPHLGDADGTADDMRESQSPGEFEWDENEDWLLEAAREYYAQGVAS